MDAATNSRVATIHAHVTIFQVLAAVGVRLSSQTTQQIRCPFHRDTTPSARIYADKNMVYCFTCGKLWDVIGVAQDRLKLSFVDALAWLEQQFGVPSASDNIRDVVRHTLTRQREVDVLGLYEQIEARLIRQRAVLGWDRYSRALLALDTALYQHRQKTMTVEQFHEAMTAILTFATAARSNHVRQEGSVSAQLA